MGYFEEVKADVTTWIEDNMDLALDIENGNFADRDDIENYLNDTLFCEDSVTGNASGSYTFNSYEAREKVQDDIDTVREALQEFCVPAAEIGEKFLNEEWEYLDVTARCYVLGQAISAALDEIEDDIEEAFEAYEAAQEADEEEENA